MLMQKGKMWMVSGVIEIQFQKMKQLVERMNGLADGLQNLGEQQMMEQICQTKNIWISQSADAFIGKEVKQSVQITAMAESLRNVADIIEKQAKLMYFAEKANETIAVKRIY